MTVKANVPQMTSGGVLAALRNGPFPERAHAHLYEVNNATGYRSGGKQFADALIVSCWPSRGIWFAGVEVKVSRSDWKRELDDPTKSERIQSFCDYWWVAAPVGIVQLAEVPSTWGLLEVDGKKVLRTKEAPKLTPKPLTRDFVASVLRNAASSMTSARRRGHDEGWQKARDEYSPEALIETQGKLVQAQRAIDRANQALGWKENELKAAQQAIATFEATAGLPAHTIREGNYYDAGRRSGAMFKAACLMRDLNAEHVAKQFADVADALRALPKTDDGGITR